MKSQHFVHNTPQLTQTEIEHCGNFFKIFSLLDKSFINLLYQALRNARSTIDGGIAGGPFRPTAQAGAKTCFLSRFSAGKNRQVVARDDFAGQIGRQ